MKNLVSKIIVVLFVSLFPIVISAQINKKTEIKQIEAYSKTLDTFIKNNQNRHPVFGRSMRWPPRFR